MFSLKKLIKDESGQSVVLIAIVFVVLCVFAACVIDIGRVAFVKQQMQNAADAAALAGAQKLPDAAAAEAAAVDYARKNGMETAETTVDDSYRSNEECIGVTCTRTVQYTFARLIGYTTAEVSATAIAEKSGINTASFDYAVFSGSTTSTLTFNGSGLYIGGNAHTNYKFVINGSNQTVTGSAEAVSTFTINGSSITIGQNCQGSSVTTHGSSISIGKKVIGAASVIAMPDFSASIKTEAGNAGTDYTGSKTFSGSNISVVSPIYVDGNVIVNGSNFTGSGIIVATGNITFNGSSLQNASGEAICFYSVNGNITVNGAGAQLDGIVYAPNGSIIMNGSNQTVHGRVIGKSVTFNGSGVEIIAGAGDLYCLPSATVQIIG